MAKPFPDITTTIVLILNVLFYQSVECGSSSLAHKKHQISENFGQDLTEAINGALQGDNSSTYKTVLREALIWSSVVYYETDILLNDIEDVIPVIDLLNELNPDDIPHSKIILSLNYLNKTNGHFLWNRMADVYYNLNKNSSAKIKSNILNSLVVITTNFASPIYWDVYTRDGYCPSKVIFTNYVKEYVNLYFGVNAIPVGLINTESFPVGCQPQKSFPVDDLIFFKKIDLIWEFPIFMDEFSQFMDKALQNIQKNATIFVKSTVSESFRHVWEPTPYTSGERNYQIKAIVSAIKQNQDKTQNFITKLYQNAGSLFNYMILSWASLKSRNVILGNAMENVSNEVVVYL